MNYLCLEGEQVPFKINIMNQKINIGQAFLDALFSLLYCLALQKAIENFSSYSKSIIYKNRPYCFPLQFHCFSIAKPLHFPLFQWNPFGLFETFFVLKSSSSSFSTLHFL